MNRKQALRRVIDQEKCKLCMQSGGVLKKQVDLNIPRTLRHTLHYYHPFCAFFLGRHMNPVHVTNFRLNKRSRALYQ